MKYIISTLGCKVNQYETQAIETMMIERGHSPAAPGETADAVIVNTCAVTAESGRKSRQALRKLKEENPGALSAVCGCYSQLSPEEVAETGADIVFGTNDHEKFVLAIEKALAEKAENEEFTAVMNSDKPFERRLFEELPAGAVYGRTRAMLKIQDGCANFCSYCIIPYTRGRPRSLPLEKAVEKTEELRKEGYKEVVLTGIEIASYGIDLPGKPGLTDLICAVSAAAGDMRLRLGSIEPTVITPEFCERTKELKNLCRHFHLSLQSGCSRTLKAMNRKYDADFFYERVCLLREAFPGCGITCDLITGFPGETDEDFKSTLAFIQKCGFSAMHVFPYSRRPGTPADKMPEQCPNKLKSARAGEAIAAASKMHKDFLAASVGSVLPVLFETEENGLWEGHSDTYVLVKAPGELLRGKVYNVLIKSAEDDFLCGEVIE